ncbi:MAG: 4-hydroxy-2-oxoheptanedioate aldolase, partial [Parasphingorhabdus sp.]
MKVEVNTFTQALGNNQKQIGLWASLCSNYAAEVIAPSGYDWVLLDMEHSPNSIDGVLGQLEVFASCKTTAIVRPPWNDSVMVKRLLDIGAP